jgi:hypothetical protein
MGRGAGLLGGVVAGVVLATTAASASTTITIDRATVPGGASGRRVLISVTYDCESASGVQQIVADAEDSETSASGEGRAPATCDGGSHFTDVTVESGNAGVYRRNKPITATVRLADASGNAVDGASDHKILYPH